MCRNRIKTDVGKENDGGTRKHSQRFSTIAGLAHNCLAKETDARQAVWCEWSPVAGIYIERSDGNYHANNNDLNENHSRVEPGAFTNALDKDCRHSKCNQNGWQIKPCSRRD